MAIPAVSAAYVNQGPTKTGQILAGSGLSEAEVALVFTATATLDGALTTFTLNWIDGTQTLPYVPTGVILFITGGTQAAATVQGINVSAITNTGCTVNLSTAGTNANTVKVAGFVLK